VVQQNGLVSRIRGMLGRDAPATASETPPLHSVWFRMET
jgi:hypothetical protein